MLPSFLLYQSSLRLTSQTTRIKTIIHFDIQEYILDGVKRANGICLKDVEYLFKLDYDKA